MAKRGRKSGASLEIAHLAAPIQTIHRPDAPYDLTDEEADEWRATVGRLPADWFPRETWPMLTQYCRHVVNARRIAQLITAQLKRKKFEISIYDKLLAMQEREGRAISSLATRMRITQQTTYDKSRKKGEVVSSEPWNFE
jgi:hypothetical protein